MGMPTKFSKTTLIIAVFVAFMPCSSGYMESAAVPRETGRFTIVCNVPDQQFVNLYNGLKTASRDIGSFFDPRYENLVRTDGSLSDRHGNLHITLASCDADKANEEKCKGAVRAALADFRHQVKGWH